MLPVSAAQEPCNHPPVDSLADAHRVFLEGARIAERWNGRACFVILDTHFDLGLSFLATWSAWRADPQRPQQLHYLAMASCSRTAPALCQLHAAWPELSLLSQNLVAMWPKPVPGFHRILLADDSVVLTLIFGDVEKCLPQIDAQVDAFYVHQTCIDRYLESGKSEKNGKIGINGITALFTVLGRMAAPHAMLAMPTSHASSEETSYEAGMQAAKNTGFVFEKGPFGVHARFAPRWKPRPRPLGDHFEDERHAIVIGAGLAGSAACERLAARGWRITLIERHAQAAREASGNLAGIFMPQLAKDDNPGVRLSRAAFLFALRLWQRMGGVGHAFSGETCGVLQLARDTLHASTAAEIAHVRQFPPDFAQWLSAAAVSALPGMPALHGTGSGRSTWQGGWLFPQGGWAQPAEVCEALLAACGDRLLRQFSRQALRLQRTVNGWQVYDDHGAVIAQAPQVIVANGADARHFAQTANLPLHAVRGQVTYLPADALPSLPLILCCEGYVTRPFDGMCCVGASYESDSDPCLRTASQQGNLARLEQMLPGMVPTSAELLLAGRVGFRCVSADRLPLVGALPDYAAMSHFRGDRLRDTPRLPGLYGLLGYASRGLTWAPLASELLAAQIAGEPLPVERELAAALDPARFCLNAHRRPRKIDAGSGPESNRESD
jgi:tRNA 5-methylaminomethyl-2-thiouridine biosynthesis bifunctional protein